MSRMKGHQSAGQGRQRVWLLNGGLAIVATVAYVLLVGHLAPPRTTLSHVPWPVLASLFGAAEIFVVHLRFRHDAHTFSLSEIPLVIGLFCAGPGGLIAAQLVGGGCALAAYRRQSPVKLAFNLATYAMSLEGGIVVFHAIAHGRAPLGPWGWLAGGAAAMATSVVSVPAIFLAVTLSEGCPSWQDFLRPFGFALFGAVVTSSVGLIAIEVLASHPAAELLLVVPVVGLYAAHRAYVGEREKHQSLQFLYDSTRLLHQAPELDSAVVAMLTQAREALRADVAALCYRPSDGERLLRTRVGPGPSEERMVEIEDEGLTEVWRRVRSTNSRNLLGRADAEDLSRLVGAPDVDNGIVVTLRGETRDIGALVVANHLSDVSTFQAADVRLLETLAGHLSVALENGRLEQSLAQLRQLQHQLTYQAHHDPLTDLANRLLFAERVSEALERPERSRPVAVLFIDVDDFKTVNDSLGHAAGDELLVSVAERVSSCLRPSDTAARLGGDEFAVLLDGVGSTEDAILVAERMVRVLDRPVPIADQLISVHISIGIAIGDADADTSTMMRNADTAMYSAKAQGKARWMVFSADMHEAALRRQNLTHDLVTALDRDQFIVMFQPMMDLASGNVVAGEALVRWNHPTRGLLQPLSFVPLAEETGNIGRLTRAVLHLSCQLATTWPADPHSGEVPAVSVNLSARDFESPDLARTIQSILVSTGLPARRLIVEITETLMFRDTDRSIATLHELARTGVRIALDDFGTGYSSLNYLSQFPLHWMKIAKTFIDDLGRASSRDALTHAMVELGHTLEIGIVAEGIERPDQLRALQRIGCDAGQGFLFSPPLESRAFTSWVRHHPVPGTDVVVDLRHYGRPARTHPRSRFPTLYTPQQFSRRPRRMPPGPAAS